MATLHREACEAARLKLDDFIDRDLSLHEMNQVREHLGVCLSCARLFEFQRLFLREVRATLGDVPRVPSWALERLSARLNEARAETVVQ